MSGRCGAGDVRPAAQLGRGALQRVYAVRPHPSPDIRQHVHGQRPAAIQTPRGLARPDKKSSSGSGLPTNCQGSYHSPPAADCPRSQDLAAGKPGSTCKAGARRARTAESCIRRRKGCMHACQKMGQHRFKPALLTITTLKAPHITTTQLHKH